MEGQKEGFINNSDNVNRSEVFRVKRIIKDNRLLNMGHDDDLPVLHEEERDLVRSFGLQGVETVDDLFNRTKAPGYNPEVAKEKLNILATAVYESMVEDGREEIVIAGSESIQKSLSIMWIGKDRNNENSPSFSFMVAENFTNNFEAGDKRNNVVALLENIDFVKKNPEISDSGELKRRAEIALKFLEDPEKFKTNIFNKKEQIALVKTEKYLHKIINSSSQKESSSKDGSSEAKKIAQAAEKMSMAAEKMAKAAEKQNNGSTQKKENSKEKSDDTYDDVRNEIKGLDFDNKKQVLDYCRDLLNYLENTSYNADDLAISGETTRLLNYITKYKIIGKGEGFPEIIREVDARLSLQDSAFFMMEANGGLSDRGPGILAALGKIGEHGRFLTRDKMKFFFDNKDYRFSEAWDLIQKASYDYRNFLNEVGFTNDQLDKKFKKPITKDPFFTDKYINYQYDSNEEDKAMVEAYMLKKLGGGEKARKSLQLAQKMFEATDEMSVSNVGFINSDEFTEAIQFGRYREDDARFGKTKNAGPDVHRGWIKSLTSGWLRNFCDIKDPDQMVLAGDIKAHYSDIEAKKEFYAYHGSILVAKIAPLKLLLMEKSIKKPEEIVDMEYVKSKVDYFNKADPDNKLKLKALWIAGLLQSNMMHTSHVWDSDHIRRFKQILTKENLMLKGAKYESGQEKKYFLTEDEWKWVAKTINLNKYFAEDFVADVIGGMFKTRFKRK